ncbi:hypothetical protein S7711_03496 [Stachybotrys chartarum IBT 7711]|uniref:Ribosomal protein S21 n=1 Tax=Stachybotrys chartarum (strain CBS 109288 / IBT 7711) TaxID=1280523 RepID=A0A084AFX8_STACB|nr:hypothetical protein S7711_03496 [Stachybotrys chartarum IBT 7711]
MPPGRPRNHSGSSGSNHHQFNRGNWLLSGEMAAASRYGSVLLSRTVASPLRLSTRAFTTSLPLRSSDPDAPNPKGPPARRNPLIGNYRPRPPPEPLPVSTEHPRSPRPPTSSAEVPPNEAFPPPPPPPSSSAKPSVDVSAKKDPPATPHRYDATDPNAQAPGPVPVDVMAIISAKSARYGESSSIQDPMSRPKVRTKAVLGRTIFVGNNFGPTAAPTVSLALNSLNRLVRSEQISSKFYAQRFHERKGLKRKRLAMTRWRKRFKDGFKATVNRVLELKRQGW